MLVRALVGVLAAAAVSGPPVIAFLGCEVARNRTHVSELRALELTLRTP